MRDEYPNPATFRRLHEASNLPLVVRGAIQEWPAVAQWTVESLATRIGSAKVELEYSPQCLFDPISMENSGGLTSQCLPYKEVVPLLSKKPQVGAYYIREADILDAEPGLISETNTIPLIPEDARRFSPRIWIGGEGASSPLHFDGGDYNILAHISGKKRFRLCPPSQTHLLYPATETRLPHLSRVNHLNPDLRRYPLYGEAHFTDTILEPGDLIFVPRYWWHCTTSLTPTISINYFWQRSTLSRLMLKLESLLPGLQAAVL